MSATFEALESIGRAVAGVMGVPRCTNPTRPPGRAPAPDCPCDSCSTRRGISPVEYEYDPEHPYICYSRYRAPGTVPDPSCECRGCTARRRDGIQSDYFREPRVLRPVPPIPPVTAVSDEDLEWVVPGAPGDELDIIWDADDGVMTVGCPSGAEHRWRLRGRFPYSLAELFEELIRTNYPDRNPYTVMTNVTMRWLNLPAYQQTDCLATRSVLRRAASGRG